MTKSWLLMVLDQTLLVILLIWIEGEKKHDLLPSTPDHARSCNRRPFPINKGYFRRSAALSTNPDDFLFVC